MNKIQKSVITVASILIFIFGISWFAPVGGIKICDTHMDWSKYDPNNISGNIVWDVQQNKYVVQSQATTMVSPSCYFKPLPFWGDYYRADKSISGLIAAIITVLIPAMLLCIVFSKSKIRKSK